MEACPTLIKNVQDMSIISETLIKEADEVLDLRGLNCPMPLLKTKQKLNKIDRDTVLFVMTTDQGSIRDFNAYIGLSETLSLISQSEDSEVGEYYFLIRRDTSS